MSTNKSVYCEKCHGEITFRGDLVTATFLLEVLPYHVDCYAKDLKGAKTLFLDNQPLNGFSGTFLAIVSLLVAIGWSIVADGAFKWGALLALIPVGYRLYSYLTYERFLER
ncbi:hypothetical protein [Aquibacillus sediminis]|uniref:hypothetical protein n=1 Tax=Aquibacillus sediminis TaxID=2574734 RepID=UPI001109B6D4|nr:hypothetical protein [Aquibacillus sediminis]